MHTLHEQYITTPSGKKKAVILPIKDYQQLLEDLHDLAVLAERLEEAPISLHVMKQRLHKDGIL